MLIGKLLWILTRKLTRIHGPVQIHLLTHVHIRLLPNKLRPSLPTSLISLLPFLPLILERQNLSPFPRRILPVNLRTAHRPNHSRKQPRGRSL
jgi:hypothetical protein